MKMIAAVLIWAASGAAFAQQWPTKTVRVVTTLAAGSATDILARTLAERLATALGQPVIVENRAGAGGNVGADVVAKAEADGTTLLMSSAGILTAKPFLYSKMPFDAETAFVPVSNVADMSMLVVVRANLEAKSLGDLMVFARAHPDKLNFGSAGIGTTGHLGLAMLMHAAQVKFAHVPYRGAAPAVTDLIAGQIDGVVDNPPTVLPHISGGRLRALAVAAKQRLPLLPDVPTAAEAGVPNYEASSWFGIVAPAGTPRPIVERLHKEIAAAVRTPAMRERFASTGARLLGDTPAEFAARIKKERAMWGEIIRAANIKAE